MTNEKTLILTTYSSRISSKCIALLEDITGINNSVLLIQAKVKAKELRGKKKEDLEKQLDDLKQVGHNDLNKNYSPFQ